MADVLILGHRGADIVTVQRLLGHSDINATRKMLWLNPAALSDNQVR